MRTAEYLCSYRSFVLQVKNSGLTKHEKLWIVEWDRVYVPGMKFLKGYPSQEINNNSKIKF